MSTIDITIPDLLIIYALLVVPIGLIAYYRLGLVRQSVVAIVRMSVQLALVGLYLRLIFQVNSILLNFAWLIVMLLVANGNVLRSASLRARQFFLATLAGVSISTVVVLAVFVFAAVQPTPIYDARYLIPIGGMLLGNCMRGNIVSLERFYSGIHEGEKEHLTYIFMGATIAEATRGHLRKALAAALAPTVSSMATMGIVTLPGMMTGQILGGSDPTTAIKYQMAIMVAIFTAVSLGAYLNLKLSMRVAFTDRGTLREDVIAKRG